MSYGNDSDNEPMSAKMLEDIRDVSQSHMNINRKYARYNIHYGNKWSQAEWKGAFLSRVNMGKGLQKVFICVLYEILQGLPISGESG